MVRERLFEEMIIELIIEWVNMKIWEKKGVGVFQVYGIVGVKVLLQGKILVYLEIRKKFRIFWIIISERGGEQQMIKLGNVRIWILVGCN